MVRAMHATDLPPPSPESLAASALLVARLRAEIESQGSISFARYMARALYEPGLGYYSSGRVLLGPRGDFVTSAELGSLYARCLARALAPVLKTLEAPEVLEIGPGSGAFAADFAEALLAEGVPLARYHLIEVSPALRERQIATLEHRVPGLMPRMSWLAEPPTQGWEGVLVANEVIDALPVRVHAGREAGLVERRVVLDGGGLGVAEQPADAELIAAVAAMDEARGGTWPLGQIGETRPGLAAFVHRISARLLRGLVVFADYGDSAAELSDPRRHAGTLVAHYRQRVLNDPFWNPGLCDLTASVDFSALAAALRDAGLDLCTYAHQASFLIAAGLGDIVGELDTLPERERLKLTREIKLLTLPGEMGERFKLMIASRGLDPEALPEALTLPGQRHRLQA
ncbi:MAG: SAM-dependent methyltransferase [Xanthomonadales bacterium]|jgi:SAM-dependent MidA family methyltransferase|nr:SAM-dependent methyltransferase [Xanthomonadales bacterium]